MTNSEFKGFLRAILAASGWRRWLILFLAGLVSAASFAPLDMWIVIFPAYSLLLWQLDRAPSRKAGFAAGWWFGFGQFLGGLYWIASALFVDIDKFWWLVPFAGLGFPAGFALFTGIVGAAYVWLRVGGISRGLALAALWTLGEYARGHLLTGFPWNLAGYGFESVIIAKQSAALIGSYGLSFLTLLIGAAPVILGDQGMSRRVKQRAWIGFATLVLAVLGYGLLRLKDATTAAVPNVTLRLVQANILERDKWRQDLSRVNFERHLDLSRSPGRDPLTAIIWPESATAFALENSDIARAAIHYMLPPGALLLTGTLRLTRSDDGARQAWNAMVALDDQDQIVATYDKAHLVPFGEYMPLRRFLPIDKLVPGGDFSAGPGPETLRVPGLPPFSPLICYEIIFPGAVTNGHARPDWLLNLTNDGWYFKTDGPYQHFAMAGMRAVEEGLPVVRVANTGISGVFDAYGRVRGKIPLETTGFLDVALPLPAPGATLYSRLGDGPLLGLIGVVLTLSLIKRLRRRQIRS